MDLHQGLDANLGHAVSTLSVTATTPGVIYKNTIVMGSSVSEGGDAAKDKQKFNTNRGVAYWEDGDDRRTPAASGVYL